MNKVVLDASAVTAVLRRERGHENVVPFLYGSLISSVNLAEVICTSRLHQSDPDVDEYAINLMQLRSIPFDDEHAKMVAAIYSSTLGSTVALAGRACLSLGLMHRLPVLTSDSDWLKHDIGVEVRLFRKPR